MTYVSRVPLRALAHVVAPLALAGAATSVSAYAVGAGNIAENRPRLAISQTAPLFTVVNSAPGMHEVRRVIVTNRGTAAGRLRLTVATTGSTRLANRLRVRIRMGSRVVYGGWLRDLTAIRLGRIPPKARRRFRVGIRFPTAPTNQNRL
ncbi:MAG: hypothetical protein M3304_07205 [Actinomycetota bacterium]|nr:hypothetical protein [Actinomycetota bacterium]